MIRSSATGCDELPADPELAALYMDKIDLVLRLTSRDREVAKEILARSRM